MLAGKTYIAIPSSGVGATVTVKPEDDETKMREFKQHFHTCDMLPIDELYSVTVLTDPCYITYDYFTNDSPKIYALEKQKVCCTL